jgi:hypothetical protein
MRGHMGLCRWVDYSKKYGLGYKLSNGCSGVFFNDATKMLLSTDGDSLCYIERLRREDGSKYDERKPHRLRYHMIIMASCIRRFNASVMVPLV